MTGGSEKNGSSGYLKIESAGIEAGVMYMWCIKVGMWPCAWPCKGEGNAFDGYLENGYVV